MTELLLRGPQTIGEIRTRASRMQAFDDLQVAQAVVDTLVEKGLVEAVTPPGRGQVFAHTLYPPQERQYLEARIEKHSPAEDSGDNRSAVDKLLERLESVNERIDALEQRIADLES